MRKIIAFLLLCALPLLASVGEVKELKGNATVSKNLRADANATEEAIKLAVGDQLEVGDEIATLEKDALVKIVMSDGTQLTVGGDSKFTIEEYSEESNNASFNLLGGTLRTVTGKIGKVAPDQFKVKTRTATMGIRGTDFVSVLAENGALDSACIEGTISVTNDLGESIVEAGKMSSVMPDGAPSAPVDIPAEFLGALALGASLAIPTPVAEVAEEVNATVEEPAKIFVEFGVLDGAVSSVVVTRDGAEFALSDENKTIVFADSVEFNKPAVIKRAEATIRAAKDSVITFDEATQKTNLVKGVVLLENNQEFSGVVVSGKAVVALYAGEMVVLVLEGHVKIANETIKEGFIVSADKKSREYTKKEVENYYEALGFEKASAKKYLPKPKIYKF